MKIAIRFGQTDPAAKAASRPTLHGQAGWSKGADLQKERRDVVVQNYATLEPNQAVLDGTQRHFPTHTNGRDWGFWSDAPSDENGEFAAPPRVDIAFGSAHKSAGLSLYFYPFSDDWASKVEICWFAPNGTTLLHRGQYRLGGTTAVVQQAVSGWGRITIAFLQTNIPRRFIKLQGLEYGLIRQFDDQTVDTAEILEEIDPLSDVVSVNTLRFCIKTHHPAFSHISGNLQDDMLMRGQSLQVEADGKPFGTFFLDNWKDTTGGGMVFSFSAHDALGVLDKQEFMGGVYTGKPAIELVEELWNICFPTRFIRYRFDKDLADATVTGFLPISSCRQALQQIAFAIGAAVNSEREGVVWLYKRDVPNIAFTARPRLNEAEEWSRADELLTNEENVEDYATLEPNQALLDGRQRHFPTQTKGQKWGWWSSAVSDQNGCFATPPTLDTTFGVNHRSEAITLHFYPAGDAFARTARVHWYDSYGAVMHSGTYTLSGLQGVIPQAVSNYKRVKIELLETNIPQRRIRLQAVDFGMGAHIGLERIYQGGHVARNEYYSGVELTAYTYQKTEDVTQAFKGEAEAGTVAIRFAKPLHSLTAQGAKILQSGANFAVLSVAKTGQVLVQGKAYRETETTHRLAAPPEAGEHPNLATYRGATLITPALAPAKAAELLGYLQNRTSLQSTVRLGALACGTVVRADTQGRPVVGIVESMRIDIRANKAEVNVVGNVENSDF